MHIKNLSRNLTILIVAALCVFIFGYEAHDVSYQKKQIKKHSFVISGSVWNFDKQAPRHYLDMASQMYHYESVEIMLLFGDEPFITIVSDDYTWLDKFLTNIKLIRSYWITEPILYEDTEIGSIKALYVNDNIYIYLYWFLIAILVWGGLKFFTQVLAVKASLEVRVEERTEQLRKSSEKIRVTLNSILDAVISTDINGKVVDMNSSAEKLTFWSLDKAAGIPVEEIFNVVHLSDNELVENPVNIVLREKRVVKRPEKLKLISSRGNEFIVSGSAAPIINSDGELEGVVLAFRDISEEYFLQESLGQTQKMEVIGQLAGGIAHDFNNMLGGITCAIELLHDEVVPSNETDRYFEILETATNRATGLTNKLLTFSRKGGSIHDVVDLKKVVLDTIAILETTIDRRISVLSEFDGENFIVNGDVSLLQSAIMNLGINSSHAIKDNGSISFSLRIKDLNEEACWSNSFDLKPGRFVEISVKDTGSGIEEKNLYKIFEPFFTTKDKEKGTGLGLPAVYGTVLQHNGSIEVHSEVGVGTVFTILLPLSDKKDVDLSKKDRKVFTGEGTVLVVEDEDVLREMESAMLVKMGYKVLKAENGVKALEIFKERHSEIDLVILDMIMPEMNGCDCFIEMKKIVPDVKAVLLSGYAETESIEKMKEAGLKNVIKKPFNRAVFSKAISDLIN